VIAVLLVGFGVPLARTVAHPGGLNGEGCHNNRKTGDYHCYRSDGASKSAPIINRVPEGPTYFANCAAARESGATPVRAGDPGYSRKLDRDGDGVGCE
jgi:hypothetical protein